MVIELAPFHLADGVTEDQLLELSQALQTDFLQHQPGFIKRELLRGSHGEWLDLVYWSDQQSAEAVMARVQESEACATYFSVMKATDPKNPAAGVKHFNLAAGYLE